MKGKSLHILQGISLLIATGLLWYMPFTSHKTSMIISSIIIIINALIEIFS